MIYLFINDGNIKFDLTKKC